MKLVIDIPKEMIEAAKTDFWCGSLTLGYAIKRGTPYEERLHGEWTFKHNSSDIWCSNCDENFDEIPQKFLFCPNCGADMREGEADGL